MDNKTAEIIERKGKKYLVMRGCNHTLATMVMLKQIPIYWLDHNESKDPIRVESPQTIYGGVPNRFGMLIE